MAIDSTRVAANASPNRVENEPLNAQAHLMLGDALLQVRRPVKTVPHLRTALDLDSSLVRAHTKLGKAFALLDRNEAAVRHLELGAKLDDDGSSHYQLYTLYRKLGHKEKAAAALRMS